MSKVPHSPKATQKSILIAVMEEAKEDAGYNSTRVPHPVVLVLGRLTLGFVPTMPEIELSPYAVLLILLPPILYPAAVSPRCGVSGRI